MEEIEIEIEKQKQQEIEKQQKILQAFETISLATIAEILKALESKVNESKEDDIHKKVKLINLLNLLRGKIDIAVTRINETEKGEEKETV